MNGLNSSTLVLFSDGGSRGNPGHAAGGVVIFWKGQEIFRLGSYLGVTTNNVAEYSALLEGLQQCLLWSSGELPFPVGNWQEIGTIECRMDSQLVVEQMNGRYKIRDANMQKLSGEVFETLKKINLPHRIVYIPRKENAIADTLVNITLDKRLGK